MQDFKGAVEVRLDKSNDSHEVYHYTPESLSITSMVRCQRSTKKLYSYHLKKICNNLVLNINLEEAMALTSIHSIHKFAVNKGRSSGLSRDSYCSTLIPYVDAKITPVLCTGRPVAYLIHIESSITL